MTLDQILVARVGGAPRAAGTGHTTAADFFAALERSRRHRRRTVEGLARAAGADGGG